MKRLTTKVNGEYRLIMPNHTHDGDLSNFNAELEKAIDQAINKLGLLEVFEEALAIDCVTLISSLASGIYWKAPDGRILYESAPDIYPIITCIENHNYWVIANGCGKGTKLYFQDYGKTWALTYMELE